MATVFPFRANLLNGAVSNMAVNGSVTPQNFDFAPTTATERFQIFESSFILSTAGNVNELITKFADFAPLTNGLDLSFLFSGQTYSLTGLIKNNFDLYRVFVDETVQIGNGNRTVMIGRQWHDPPIIFQPNDRFRVTVRDNLTGLTAMGITLAGKMFRT